MHDEQQRPRGATGSICAVAEDKIGEDPKQLELWSASQSTNNAAIGSRQHRGASIDNTRPTRAPGQGAAPKFVLTEGIVTVPQAASSFDHEIRVPLRDELLVSAPSAGTQWFHPALVTGALAVVLGLGWIGGSSSSLFFAPAPASTSVQQTNSSGCTGQSSKGTVCATTKSDREVTAGAPNTGKIASPEAARVNRRHESSRGTQQASAATNRTDLTTNTTEPASAAILPRPTAMPETRPTTIEGWTIRDVVGGTVILEGPGGVWRATQGDTVPGVGRVDSIVRWGSRWIVATTKGLISTQN
jgi:hypothetical protein